MKTKTIRVSKLEIDNLKSTFGDYTDAFVIVLRSHDIPVESYNGFKIVVEYGTIEIQEQKDDFLITWKH